MMRRAASLAVGDRVGAQGAVVVAVEPLGEHTLRLTLFVDGQVAQQDAHMLDSFDNVQSPPMLVEALGALAGLARRVEHAAAGRGSFPIDEMQAAADVLVKAYRSGMMLRVGGFYVARKS